MVFYLNVYNDVMNAFFKKLELFATKRLSDFTLTQVHNFATIIIFIFTVIFAYLLTLNEYQGFERALENEHTSFVNEQNREIIFQSQRLSALLESEFSDSLAEKQYIIEIFSKTDKDVIQLYQGDNLLISTSSRNYIKEIHTLKREEILSLDIDSSQLKSSMKVVLLDLDEEYTLVSGIYTKSNTLLIQQKQKILKTRMVRIALEIATLAFILFGIIFAMNKIISAIMQRDANSFLVFFERAAHRHQVINFKQLFFKELRIMGQYANDMLETIMHQKESLIGLNSSLEQKVQNKTLALEEKNRALEGAQKFSEDLIQTQKNFLRHAIHETNTPLSVIMNSIELSVLKNGKDKHLSRMDAAVKNIFSIYDDLSYLVKKDQVAYPRMSINLDSYLKGRIDFFNEVAKQSRLEFKYEANAVDAFIYFNETKLQRIVDNNITNAIKYTIANETITLSSALEGSHIVFSIHSRSKKIEDVDKIFNSFYREESSIEGFGIGLNLVASICAQEDVKIEIDSSDTLTTFTYTFKVMGR